MGFPIHLQYVKKLFETNKGNFSGSKPIIGRRITFNPEEIGAFGLEQFFLHTVNHLAEYKSGRINLNLKCLAKNMRRSHSYNDPGCMAMQSRFHQIKLEQSRRKYERRSRSKAKSGSYNSIFKILILIRRKRN